MLSCSKTVCWNLCHSFDFTDSQINAILLQHVPTNSSAYSFFLMHLNLKQYLNPNFLETRNTSRKKWFEAKANNIMLLHGNKETFVVFSYQGGRAASVFHNIPILCCNETESIKQSDCYKPIVTALVSMSRSAWRKKKNRPNSSSSRLRPTIFNFANQCCQKNSCKMSEPTTRRVLPKTITQLPSPTANNFIAWKTDMSKCYSAVFPLLTVPQRM